MRIGFLLGGVAGIATQNAVVAAIIIAVMLVTAFAVERRERRQR